MPLFRAEFHLAALGSLAYRVPFAYDSILRLEYKRAIVNVTSNNWFFPLLNNSTGGAAEAELEWALHSERSTVCSAPAHGSSAGSCRVPLVSHVRWTCGVLHGPGQGFPGPSGQAEQTAGGLSRVQLPQSYCPLFTWYVWFCDKAIWAIQAHITGCLCCCKLISWVFEVDQHKTVCMMY